MRKKLFATLFVLAFLQFSSLHSSAQISETPFYKWENAFLFSLQKKGIDTIGIYDSFCSGCRWGKQSALIFWKKQGQSFAIYKTDSTNAQQFNTDEL